VALEIIRNGSNKNTNKNVEQLFKAAVNFGEIYAYQHYGYFLYLAGRRK